LVVSASAQSPSTGDETPRAIRQLEATRRQALLDANVAVLKSLLADDFVEVTGNGIVRRKSDNIADLSEGRLKFFAATATDEDVRVFGPVALYTANFQSRGTFSGRPIGNNGSRISRLYAQRGGRWVCVYAQTTRSAP
jgi:ketosteroid isomerase-like protein